VWRAVEQERVRSDSTFEGRAIVRGVKRKDQNQREKKKINPKGRIKRGKKG